MEPVVAELVFNPDQYKKAADESDREPCYVDQSKTLLADSMTYGEFEIVPEHRQAG